MKSLFDTEVWYKLLITDVNVYLAICQYYNWYQGYAFPSIAKLVETSKMPRASVMRAIKRLQGAGIHLISVKQYRNDKGHKVNRYYVLDYLIESAKTNPSLRVILGEILSIISTNPSITLSTRDGQTQVSPRTSFLISNNTNRSLTKQSITRENSILKETVFRGIPTDERVELVRKGLL